MSAFRTPSDVDPASVIDLIEDCREVSGVLGSFVPTGLRLPQPRAAGAPGIDPATAAMLDGYGEYGT